MSQCTFSTPEELRLSHPGWLVLLMYKTMDKHLYRHGFAEEDHAVVQAHGVAVDFPWTDLECNLTTLLRAGCKIVCGVRNPSEFLPEKKL